MLNSLFGWLFDPSGLTPHGFCLLWEPGLIWTYASADFVIGVAYFMIPFVLVAFVRQRRDLAFRPLFWLFATFILLCGVTHWLDLVTLWVPAYGVEGLAKVATAIASVATAFTLWRLLPQALALPSPAQLREANEALRKSEDFLARVGRVAGIGGYEADPSTGTVYWSEELCRLHGVGPGHRPTLREALDFYTPESRPVISAAIDRALATGEGWDLELQIINAEGRRIWIRNVGSIEFANGKATKIVGSLKDLDARVTQRIALEEATKRVTLATDAGRIGIWDWDVATDQIIWDPWMYRLYGLEPRDEMASYELWMRHIHSDDRAGAETALQEGADGTEPFDTEFRIVWSDGSVHYIRAVAKVTRDETGRALRMVGTNWDITEAKQLNADLARAVELQAEAAEREMALFRNSPDGLVVVRVEEEAFVFEACSPAYEVLTGLKSVEVIGRTPEEGLPPEIGENVLSRYRRCLKERKTIPWRETYTFPIGTREFEGTIAPVPHPATGKIVRLVGAMRDVTDYNAMERALRQAQKMEAIGRLSAGVAHDFNNILQTIVGGLELMLDEVKETPAHEFAQYAIKAAVRGAALTHHLLSYARKQILRPQTVDVTALLAETEVLLARTLGPQIAVSVRAYEMASIMADPGQLQTSLLNLAINASHAMPNGGSLIFDAREESEAGKVWVVISVTDTGVGMDEVTLAHAVEPFFTTKGLGGSGLGLSMVQGFAEQSGGSFLITSAPGQGTTVELRMPSAAACRHPEKPQLEQASSGLIRILLVDDSADVLATTSAFLENSGFTVMGVDSGDKALAVLSRGERFDAAISDYAMPGLNGADLIAEAQLVQPGLQALLITGYAGVTYADTLPDGTPLLYKPFQRGDLLEAIRLLTRPLGSGPAVRLGEAGMAPGYAFMPGST
jgi:PAS domain S-box-containing protein